MRLIIILTMVFVFSSVQADQLEELIKLNESLTEFKEWFKQNSFTMMVALVLILFSFGFQAGSTR